MPSTSSEFSYRISEFERVVFDVDGTLLLDGRPLPGAVRFVANCRQAGLKVCFGTNASFVSATDVSQNLCSAGIEAHPGECLTAIEELGRQLLATSETKTIAFLGDQRSARVLAEIGLEPVSTADFPVPTQKLGRIVIAGLLPEVDTLSIRSAAETMDQRTIVYSPNRELGLPTTKGLVPGTAAIVARVEAHCGFPVPVATVGKPSTLFSAAIDRISPTRGRTLMIGDGLETDIELARRVGWQSVLIDESHLRVPRSRTVDHHPGLVVRDLDHLLLEIAQ